jgi:hypothetical protein
MGFSWCKSLTVLSAEKIKTEAAGFWRPSLYFNTENESNEERET